MNKSIILQILSFVSIVLRTYSEYYVDETSCLRNELVFDDLEHTAIKEVSLKRGRKAFAKVGNYPNRHFGQLLHRDPWFVNTYKLQMLEKSGLRTTPKTG